MTFDFRHSTFDALREGWQRHPFAAEARSRKRYSVQPDGARGKFAQTTQVLRRHAQTKTRIFGENTFMVDLDYLHYLETQLLTPERKMRFHKVLQNRTQHFTVVVEDLFQLHNTSAVMRSCEVFGVQQLHVVEERYGKRIDKEIAMGAQKWVDVARHDNILDALQTVKSQGYQIVATTPHHEDCDLADFDITPKSAFFFGTERNGLSEAVLAQADAFLKIPMVGFTESLNISVSAAIILQDLTSRLRKSNLDWRMGEAEIFEKRLEWARNSIKDIARIEARYYGR